jgi:hypothetical protein
MPFRVISNRRSAVSLERIAQTNELKPPQIHQQVRSYRQAGKLSANFRKKICGRTGPHPEPCMMNKTQAMATRDRFPLHDPLHPPASCQVV